MAKGNNGFDDEDTVGYGRPPKHAQFKRGQSGNPKGRPKGAKSFATILEREGRRLQTVTINGKSVRLTKKELVAMQMYLMAMKGDLKAMEKLMAYEPKEPFAQPFHVTIEFEEEQIRELEKAEREEQARLDRLEAEDDNYKGIAAP